MAPHFHVGEEVHQEEMVDPAVGLSALLGVSGQELDAAERAMLQQVFGRMRRGGAGPGGGTGSGGGARASDFGGSYIVFALRAGRPTPLRIQTGLTDLDHIEVTTGLSEQDTVLVLPSASLVQSQREMRDRFQRMTGGGLPGVQRQPQGSSGGQQPRGTR